MAVDIVEPTRKIFKLVEQEVELEHLVQGDIFRMEPASASDHHAKPDEYFHADKSTDTESEPISVMCSPVSITKSKTIMVRK